jgi:LysM repeat protein
MQTAPRRSVVLGTAAAALLLLLAAPTPSSSLRTLRNVGAATDAAAPLVALLALLAWALAAWLLLTVAVTAGGHLPGWAGTALRALGRRVAPATARRAVEIGLGLTVAVGVLGASPAAAAPGPPAAPGPAATASASRALPAAASAPDLDWAAPAPGTAPGLDWGAPTPAPEQPAGRPAGRAQAAPAQDLDRVASAQPATAPAAPEAAVEPAGDAVVVQPGDSLWELAERDLATRGESVDDAAVAQAWPSWWAANRDAVGEDPDLIQPGTRLAPPTADGSPPSAPS